MTRRDALSLAGCALLLAAAVAPLARGLQISTGLGAFVAAVEDPELAELAAELADSPAARTLILSVGAPDLATALGAARRWAPQLRAHAEVAELAQAPPAGLAQAVRELYFPHRYGLLSSEPERELPERYSDAGLARAARELREALLLPDGALARETAAQDPLQTFAALLRRFEDAAAGGAALAHGQFATRDRTRAVLFVTTHHSALDAAQQAPLLAHVEDSFARLDAELGGVLTLERSGIHRFAVASEASARRELSWLSALSLPLVVLLFLALFRSLRLLLLALLPLALGLALAAGATQALFGSIHALALAFGATLIGVCIDYPIHYLNHHALLGNCDARASLRAVRPALLLGALTTLAGFAALAAASIPGVQQLGIFASVGVSAAVAATFWVLPPLLPRVCTASALHRGLARWLGECLARLARRPRLTLALWTGAALLVLVSLPQLRWRDDVFGLNVPLQPQWLAEEVRVRESISQLDPGRFVIALGRDADEALARNDAAHERLLRAQGAGWLVGFRSLHSFLFSPELQRRNWSALAALPELPARAGAALAAQGFRPQLAAQLAGGLEQPPAPLRLAALRESPLGFALRGLYSERPGRVAVITPLRGVRNAAALEAALSELPGVRYYDQQQLLASAYGRYRGRAQAVVAAGLAAILALLYARYRSAGLALCALAPALAACALTVSALTLASIAVDLLHLLGLLLVLSLGVDYAVFLLEARTAAEERAAAFAGVALDCASTVLSFGLLAMSSFPALRSLGSAAAVGVALALLLAPGAVLLAERAQGRPS